MQKEQSSLQTMKIIFNYIVSDVQRKPRSFKIGLFTIYLVVTFVSLVQSAFQLSPLIFMQLAETQAGDADMLIVPIPLENDTSRIQQNNQFGPTQQEDENDGFVNPLANFTSLLDNINLINQSKVQNTTNMMDSSIFGTSPRWLFLGDLLNPNKSAIKISDKMRSFVLIIDSEEELSVGIGRRLDVKPLSYNETYVTSSALRGLNISVGDPIILNLDIIGLFLSQSGQDINGEDEIKKMLDEQIQNGINQFIADTLGEDILNIQFNTTLVKDLGNSLIDFIEEVDQDEESQAELIEQIDNFIDDQNLDQDIKDNLKSFVDDVFEQNITEILENARDIIDGLPNNTTFTLRDFSSDLSPILIDSLNISIDLKVKESIKSSKGKWADGLGNVVCMDSRNFTKMFLTALKQNIEQNIEERVNDEDDNVSAPASIARLILFDPLINLIDSFPDNFTLSEYSLMSNIIFKDRVNIYTDSDTIKSQIIKISDQFYRYQGLNSQASVPLSQAISGFFMMKYFLDNMVFSATALLLMLAILLIYSLMIGDVEEKTYEFGMLRALGFNKLWIVILLMLESFVFSIPGLILGMLTSYLINSIIAMIIFSSTDLVSSYQLHPSAIALGIILGLIIPLVSNVLPIQRALSKTLRDSLDLYHRVINEVLVQVIKLEKMGISLEQTLTAVLLVVMGFVSYYLAPMAFVFQDIQLFLAIINIILIIMILGLTLLINLLQRITYLLFNYHRSH